MPACRSEDRFSVACDKTWLGTLKKSLPSSYSNHSHIDGVKLFKHNFRRAEWQKISSYLLLFIPPVRAYKRQAVVVYLTALLPSTGQYVCNSKLYRNFGSFETIKFLKVCLNDKNCIFSNLKSPEFRHF